MADLFESFGDNPSGPARRCFVVTPHNSNALPYVTKAIRADGNGTITFRPVGQSEDIAHPVLAGERIDVHATHVRDWLRLMFGPTYGCDVRRHAGAALPPAGPVHAAAIGGDGTILSVVMQDVAAGSWADYGIAGQASTMPGVALATTTAGFDRSGGQAVANAARSRPLIALRPCRKMPIVPTGTTTPNSNLLDEVDNGDGTRTVRLRLSRPVYAGDACTLSLGAGWRTGAPAQAGIAVTNNSALAAPKPVFRWITPPFQRVTGAFRVELAAGSLNPEGRSGLAAVRFTVTDGTTINTIWTDGLSTSPADGTRCWGANVDPTGLTAGPISVHATLYPWIGPSRSTGSGQAAATAGHGYAAEVPLTMAYDPAGTRYPPAYVHIDPVNGTATASAAMVQPSLSAAKAVANASKAVSLTCALQAIRLAARSAGAANGGAALTRMADNAFIVLPPGTTTVGATSVSTDITSLECWPVVIGDPDDANPRANCILESAAATPVLRVTPLSLRNLTYKGGGGRLSSCTYMWADNVTITARTGQEASASGLTQTSTNSAVYYTNCSTGGTAIRLATDGQSARPKLVRNCQTPREIIAQVIIGSTQTYEAGQTGQSFLSGWSNSFGTADSQNDWIAVGNSGLRREGNAVNWPMVTVSGKDYLDGALFLNNIVERIGNGPTPFWAMGENTLQNFSHMVIEGNSFIGDRTNTLYNDPSNLTDHNVHVDCRVANNYFDWLPTKHDDFYDADTAGSNAANFGYRPWLTDNLWMQDGTGLERNVYGRRLSTNFEPKGWGLGAVVNPNGAVPGDTFPAFVADKSVLGDGLGGGDYRPASGSPLIGVASVANLDTDRAGVARGPVFAAGALEG